MRKVRVMSGRGANQTRVRVFLLLLSYCGLAAAEQPSSPAPEYWPTAGWRESTPERQGIDSSTLLKMFAVVRQRHTRVHNVLIIRNGYVVLDASFYPYDPDAAHDLASVTKSVTSTLIGAAIQDGKIDGPDAKVLSFFPERASRNSDPRKAAMTLADLLTMRSGLACSSQQSEQILRTMEHSPDEVAFALDLPAQEESGRSFQYCSANYHVLSAVIASAARTSEADYARKILFAPLGIHDAIWPADTHGVTHGWGDLHLLPRDAAKLGFLWLYGGIWEGRRLLAESWIRDATRPLTKTPSRDAGYGYGFWAFIGKRAGEFEALGRGGQRITVLPRLNAIVVLTGGGFDPDEIGGVLGSAVKSDQALPENPAAVEALRKAMAEARTPPLPGSPSPLPAVAKLVSGKLFALESNPLDFTDFTLRFTEPQAAQLDMTLGGTRHESHVVSLTQQPALSAGQFGLPVALKGRWDKDSFILDYDAVANNHAYQLRIGFKGNDAIVEVNQGAANKPLRIRAYAR